MLDCCRPLEEVKQNGVTLPEFVCLAKCNRLKADMFRADKTTKEEFIKSIKEASTCGHKYLVVSYHRGSLNQTGTGHFSPVGG